MQQESERGNNQVQELYEDRDHNPESIEHLREQLRESERAREQSDLRLAEIQELVNNLESKLKTQSMKMTIDRKELDRLHAIIIQNVRDEEVFDDGAILKKFTNLNFAIQRLVKRHFKPGKTTAWSQYDRINGGEDRVLFLRAHLADCIAASYFDPQAAKLYGVETKIDAALCEFETALHALVGNFKSWRGRKEAG
jgi:hypothetical protein